MEEQVTELGSDVGDVEVEERDCVVGRASVPGDFTIADADSANRFVRQVVETRAYRERVESWAASEIRRAQRREEDLMGRYGPQLETWTRSELAARQGGRRKSLALPAGQVGYRSTPVTVAVEDALAATAWALVNLPASVTVQVTVTGDVACRVIDALHPLDLGPAVRTKLAILGLRGHFTATGEVPPGVTVVPSVEQFYVK